MSQHSFIHSGHFYSAPSSPLLLRGAPDYSTDTASEFHAEANRQLQVKDLPKVPTWRLERESNPRPSGWKLSTQPRRQNGAKVSIRVSVVIRPCRVNRRVTGLEKSNLFIRSRRLSRLGGNHRLEITWGKAPGEDHQGEITEGKSLGEFT